MISQLNGLPTDISIYPQSQQAVNRFQIQLAELNVTLSQEEKVQKELIKASQLALDAAQVLQNANTIEDYQTAKQQWQAIQQKLSTISSEKFLRSQLQNQRESTEMALDTIDKKINQINSRMVEKQQEEQQLEVIEQPIQKAIIQTEEAKTIEDYSLAKKQWTNIKERLEMISNDQISKSEIDSKLLEVQLKINTIVANIQQLKHRHQSKPQSQTISSPIPKPSPKPDVKDNKKNTPQLKPSPIPSGPPLW